MFMLLVSQGSSWLHVGTDQPFKSISIGAASQVWGIARDGSAFYRGSVSPQSPAGQTRSKSFNALVLPFEITVLKTVFCCIVLCLPLQETAGTTFLPHLNRS